MTVTYELDAERVAHARMDDGKANALNDISCGGLRDAIARAADDGAGALVIWGRPGMFSGGIDLGILRDDDADRRFGSLAGVAHTVLAVWTAPIPTIAAITGHAIAGGAMLAMACDRRFALAGAAKLGANETALGMVLPTWAVAILEAAIRPDCRNEVMLLGRLYDPEAAVRVGIAEAALASGEFEAAVAAAATEAVALPTRAYAGNKRMLRGAAAEHAASLVAVEMGAGFARQAAGG